MSISGNMVGSYSQLGKTFILTDESGNEITGVVVGQETIFTATDNDVREGMIYASDEGVSTGTKVIPAYHTTRASYLILPNMDYSIPIKNYDRYNYTNFQCVIAKFNTTFVNSVAVNKVALEDNVYEVNSIEPLSQITKNVDAKSIDLNITNNTEDIYVIHYFTYKEEY